LASITSSPEKSADPGLIRFLIAEACLASTETIFLQSQDNPDWKCIFLLRYKQQLLYLPMLCSCQYRISVVKIHIGILKFQFWKTWSSTADCCFKEISVNTS
jgi:hypothetical protein